MAVEQLGKVYGWDSKRKKDEAMNYAIESLREKGIEVSKKDLDMAIEAVVSQLNKYVQLIEPRDLLSRLFLLQRKVLNSVKTKIIEWEEMHEVKDTER